MILLFTSTRDDRPYHKRDLFNVCCEAENSYIQFGYRKKWIAPNLQSGKKLLKQNALVIFCELKTFAKAVFTYHPVRLARIIKASPEHESLTILLQLQEFFDYDKYRGQIPSIIQKFQDYVLQSDEQPTPSDPKNPPRFVRDESAWNKGAFCSTWVALIEHMKNLEGFKDSVFFSLQQPEAFGGPPSFLLPKHGYEGGKTTYEFKSGKSYDISLYLLPGKNAVYCAPDLIIKETVASVIGPFVKQWSSGFQADFVLQCRRSFQEEKSMLLLKIPTETPNRVLGPEIQALIKLSVPRFVLFGAVTLLTLGAALVSFGPDFIIGLAKSMGAKSDSSFIQNAFTYSWIVKLIGMATLAYGSYLGFRKLPFKTS